MSENTSRTLILKNRIYRARWFLILLVILLLLSQPFAWCMRIHFMLLNSMYAPGQFCTPEDKIFQAIKVQHVAWIEYFRNHPHPPVLYFTVSYVWGDETYTADAGYWTANDPLIFVRVEGAFKREILGSKGYFVSPTGNMPGYGIDKITHLEGDVYCYTTIWF